MAWLDDQGVEDVSEWWRKLAASGGQNKKDWKEIRMKSTLHLPKPGEAPAPETQGTYADELAGEAMEAENQLEQSKGAPILRHLSPSSNLALYIFSAK